MGLDTLGIDIGGVIMDKANDDTDTSFFTDNYLRTTATEGMFEALAHLVHERFEGRVHLVSKCGMKTQLKTRSWLEFHDFYARTGIHRDNVHFCKKRNGKRPICLELGITHFIDDRLEVLRYLEGVGRQFLFQPGEQEKREHIHHYPRVLEVHSWQEVLSALISR